MGRMYVNMTAQTSETQ